MASRYQHDFERFFHEDAGLKILANPEQHEYARRVLDRDTNIVFVDSVAGSGKTSIAIFCGLYGLNTGRFSDIKYIRNAVEIRSMGFLPGAIEEKEFPYFEPAYNVIESYRQGEVARLKLGHQLHFKTTSYLRGLDFSNESLVIIDEAQNMDLNELVTTISRCHDSCKVVVIGHSQQLDDKLIKRYGKDTLIPFQVIMRHYEKAVDFGVYLATLTKNYRGKMSRFADKIGETVKELENE